MTLKLFFCTSSIVSKIPLRKQIPEEQHISTPLLLPHVHKLNDRIILPLCYHSSNSCQVKKTLLPAPFHSHSLQDTVPAWYIVPLTVQHVNVLSLLRDPPYQAIQIPVQGCLVLMIAYLSSVLGANVLSRKFFLQVSWTMLIVLELRQIFINTSLRVTFPH